MSTAHDGEQVVIDRTGRAGRIIARSQSSEGGDVIEIALDGQQRALVPLGMLESDQQPGTYRIAGSFDDFTAGYPVDGETDENIRIPVVEEELVVGKREVETGRVRVSVVPTEREEVIDVPLTTEQVEVERVPVNQVVDAAPEPWYEGDTLVVPVIEERLVVQTQLVVTEEVRIRRISETTAHQERITLRSQDVEIDRDEHV